MKKIPPILITLLFLSLFLVQAVATHTPSVSISPQEAIVGTDSEFKLLVDNQNGDSITTVEIALPETVDGQPYYLIKEIASPAGWSYVLRYKVDSTNPYKIIWSSGSVGISEGNSLEFSFTAKAPSSLDQFEWTWKTGDSAGDVATDTVVTKTILAPFASFKLTVPQSAKAGESFNIVVAALDKDGNIKRDYAGTVSFTSSDSMALLPTDYTFTAADRGTANFALKFKTAGTQTVTVKDGEFSLKSGDVIVEPSDAISLKITPENSEVESGDAVDFKAAAMDIFGNSFDVTAKTKFSIDSEAKGTWVGNFYKAETVGIWTVAARYTVGSASLSSGTALTVLKAVGEPAEEPEGKMSIIAPRDIMVEEGTAATFNLTVENTGELDLTDVTIEPSGVPKEWIKISPILADIAVGKSYNYVLEISVPQNVSGERAMKFSATSSQNVVASKTMNLVISKPTLSLTGLAVAIITKPLYLGIVIVILIIIILIIWSLLPKEEKKKKSEE